MRSTTFVKLGTQPTEDSFSAFDGGRISRAAAGEHDITNTSTNELAPALFNLSVALADDGVTRLFTMGLATDFVVGNTILDALGENPRTKTTEPPPSLAGGQAALERVDRMRRPLGRAALVAHIAQLARQ